MAHIGLTGDNSLTTSLCPYRSVQNVLGKARQFENRLPDDVMPSFLSLIQLRTMEAFHITSLVTPLWAYVGTSINLQCIHDLSPDQVYSIKWYKDSREFFRFLPKEFSPATAFPTLGVEVNTAASNENNVSLNNLTLASGGVYECEISSEAPKFETVDHSWLVQYRQKVDSEETISPQISLLGLKMKVDPSFFPGGILSVRCIALLGPEQLYTERWSLLVQQNTSVQVTGLKLETLSLVERHTTD
uniref:(California timema) hypothetical protein n=1 Tax=Timema californicum TaxID=61474 RepID=A0A7R9PA52_TIMCA|nr:unnamed protein product [Timema californicum]